MTDDPHYAETLAPLKAFCSEHGYRWRWRTRSDGDQWHAVAQILDPTKNDQRDRVRAWISSTGHGELRTLASVVTWSIDEARSKLQTDARFGIPDGRGIVAGKSCPSSDAPDGTAGAAPRPRKPRI